MQNESIQFSFDDLAIVGVFGNRVCLRGEVFPDNADPEPCVIVVSRQLFHRALNYWLDDKKRYCERYNHFCGAMGSLRATEYDEFSEENRTDVHVPGEDEPRIVRTFKVKAFDPNTDMEHG